MDKIEVTGSRIKRLDTETTVPVEMYKMEEIEMRGYVNIGDFVQNLSFNSGTENSIYINGSFTKGAATVNIRGLGAQRFLTLANGRRLAPYALLTSNSRSVFDFNSLPSAAIDSIEFLKDGASAIYGADAVTGVLNIKLKKNFEGLYMSGYYGNTFKGTGNDTGVYQINAVAGQSKGKTSIMAAVSYKHANDSYVRDYGIDSLDLSYMGPVRGAMYSSSYGIPANVYLSRAQVISSNAATGGNLMLPTSTTARWYYAIPNSIPTANPKISDFTVSVSATTSVLSPSGARTYTLAPGSLALSNRSFDVEQSQLYPEYNYMSGYVQLEHEFTEHLTAFAQLTTSKNTTYYNNGYNPISTYNEGLIIPATNPYNPFGIPLDYVLILGDFMGPRKYRAKSVTTNLVAGVRGTAFSKWSWESAVTYGYNIVDATRSNLITPAAMQAALNGTTKDTAFNPFGRSANQALVDSLAVTSEGRNRVYVSAFDLNVTGPLVTLPWGGDLGVAAGFEYRRERIDLDPDPGRYIGYGGTAGMEGSRSITSGYLEVNLPIKAFEFAAAVRTERYNDFGTSTKPKLSAKYSFPKNKIANVILRGSFSESFQAPAIGLYYGTQSIGYSSVKDPTLPETAPNVSVKIVSGGNKTLIAEEGTTYYLGTVIEIPKVKDLSFSVDFFNMRIDNYIVTPSASYLLTDRGRAQFPNAVIRGADGTLLQINTFPQNNPDGYQYYKGLDFGLKYTLRDTRIGSFTLTGGATRILETGWDSGLGAGYIDNTGLYFNPKWRFNAGLGWSLKRFSASVATDTIGKYFNDNWTATGWGENPYTLVHVAATYRGPWDTSITIGCNNVFNNRPPDNAYASSIGVDPNAYGSGVQGAMMYTRISKRF